LTLVNSVLVFLVLEEYVPHLELILWLIAMVGITLTRLFIVNTFWSRQPDPRRLNTYKNLLLLGTHSSALVWGVLILIPGEYRLDWIEAFIAFVIAGMSAGALLSLAPLLSAAIPYLLLILMPLAIFFYQQSDFPHFAMGLMATFYLILLVRLVFSNHQLLAATLRQDIENRNLFRFLEQANQEAGLLREQLDVQLASLPELLRDKARYFDQVRTPVLITDLTGNIKLVNQPLLYLLGKDAGKILGLNIADLAGPGDDKIVLELIDKNGKGQIETSSLFSLTTANDKHPVCHWHIIRHQQVVYWSGSPV
jgi:PAS domain-containing protein